MLSTPSRVGAEPPLNIWASHRGPHRAAEHFFRGAAYARLQVIQKLCLSHLPGFELLRVVLNDEPFGRLITVTVAVLASLGHVALQQQVQGLVADSVLQGNERRCIERRKPRRQLKPAVRRRTFPIDHFFLVLIFHLESLLFAFSHFIFFFNFSFKASRAALLVFPVALVIGASGCFQATSIASFSLSKVYWLETKNVLPWRLICASAWPSSIELLRICASVARTALMNCVTLPPASLNRSAPRIA